MGRDRAYTRSETPRPNSEIGRIYSRLKNGERIPLTEISGNTERRANMARDLRGIYEVNLVISPSLWWQERTAYERDITKAGQQLGQCCKRATLCRTCPFGTTEIGQAA